MENAPVLHTPPIVTPSKPTAHVPENVPAHQQPVGVNQPLQTVLVLLASVPLIRIFVGALVSRLIVSVWESVLVLGNVGVRVGRWGVLVLGNVIVRVGLGVGVRR